MKQITLSLSVSFLLLAGSSFGQEVTKSPSTSSESKKTEKKLEDDKSSNKTEEKATELKKSAVTFEERKQTNTKK